LLFPEAARRKNPLAAIFSYALQKLVELFLIFLDFGKREILGLFLYRFL
jgi:hypothetical protein